MLGHCRYCRYCHRGLRIVRCKLRGRCGDLLEILGGAGAGRDLGERWLKKCQRLPDFHEGHIVKHQPARDRAGRVRDRGRNGGDSRAGAPRMGRGMPR